MEETVTDIKQVTPAWLTITLRMAGALPRGDVSSVIPQDTEVLDSFATHLTLTYSADAPASAPKHLVLKRNKPEDSAVESGRAEVKFYRLVAMLPDRRRLSMITPCYAAAYHRDSNTSYVLLQDVSETHKPVQQSREEQRKEMPPASTIVQVVDTLAQFHSYWWGHPLLGTGVTGVQQRYQDIHQFERYMQRRDSALQDLILYEKRWFPKPLIDLYQEVLTRFSTLWQGQLETRFRMHRNMTLIHGDCYFANFLQPKEIITGQTYIIDWYSPEVHLGASDLVNLVATSWTQEQRDEDQREEQILQRYYQGLQNYGVQGYSWEDLLVDYRLSIIEWLLQPLQDRMDGVSKNSWWYKMQCLVEAFHDWHCMDLLE